MDLMEISCKEEFLNHNEKCTAEISGEHSPSPDSLSTDGIYGDPAVLPRLGDQYQVEIPSLIPEAEHLQMQNTPIDKVNEINFNFYIGKESSIPIIWHISDHIRHAQELLNTEINSDSLSKVEVSGDQLEHGKQSACLTNLDCGTSDNPMDISNRLLPSRKIMACIPLPGSSKVPWSDSEAETFLLGLYIFGKNLVPVQRFVESKDMGDVLSFYYGKFYRSDAQRRWVECRKIRSRKSILGHRIFTGCRQQEVLSRLLANRSKDVQDSLLEVTKAFTDGSASLEEFIFTLKAIVGTKALVESVGIGKGKQDLTGITLDHPRSNPNPSSRPEIPVGKACSSLSSSEIIKFLTGDFRLSKAKSNDIFWEAVWPRLLARGWHSEQPKDSKNTLVFLISGVKKFSRKKLTKGNQYFDSVTDVLNKVAAEPSLLDFDVEDVKEKIRAEITDANNNHRPCYLRPRLPDYNSEHMKFTIVDTSLARDGPASKMRELRSLPDDVIGNYRTNHRVENNSDSSEQSSSSDTSLNSEGESDSKLSICELMIDKPSVKDTKLQFSRRAKSGAQNSLARASKRQRLTSCKLVVKEEEKFQPELLETDDRIPKEEIKEEEAVFSQEKFQPRVAIDLNLHPQELEMEVEDLKMNDSFVAKQQNEEITISPDEPIVNGRRHGTRNRPPTTKALEALACGFLSVRKERGPKTPRSRSFNSRSSHRARREVEAPLPNPNPDASSSMASSVEMADDDEYSQNTNSASLFVDDSHVLV